MSAQYDDPNRESVGLEPIWTGAGDTEPPPDPETHEDTDEDASAKASRKAKSSK